MAFRWDKEPQRILDVCAAPGGKATVLGRRWPAAELVRRATGRPVSASSFLAHLESRYGG